VIQNHAQELNEKNSLIGYCLSIAFFFIKPKCKGKNPIIWRFQLAGTFGLLGYSWANFSYGEMLSDHLPVV